jgi:uncharacterized protein YbjQ (UPF0145 family)
VNDPELIKGLIQFGLPFLLIILAKITGMILEKAHFRSIVEREAEFQDLPVTNLRTPPQDQEIEGSWLCTGSVVIGSDYFKRFVAGLKTLIGGRLRTFETLLERGRREAILRLQEEARRQGANMVINVRLETSSISQGRGRQTFASSEIFAYGTAIRTVEKN